MSTSATRRVRCWAAAATFVLAATPLHAEGERDAPESDGEPATTETGHEGDGESAADVEDPRTREARAHFVKAASLVKQAHWSEALAEFERSAELRPHPVTSYNIGACLRALGRFVQARVHFEDALAPAEGQTLPQTLVKETEAFLGEIDRLSVTLTVDLDPADASIAVDGRPLQRTRVGSGRVATVAGAMSPGPGRKAPAKVFDILMDPGPHVITLSRKGFEDAVVNKTLPPGARERLELKISRLPATLEVDASESDAVVTIDGRDVGLVPVLVPRPGGSYKVVVDKAGFTPYETTARVDPGEVWRVRAELEEQAPPLYKKWWLWTSVVAAVAAVSVTTYVVTRPDPERPPPQGGGLDWVVPIP